VFRKRLPLSDLTAPLTDVLDHWRARGGEQLACPWPQFEMHLLPPEILPTTLVVDVFDDSSRNRYRFWGSMMTQIHGTDMTGKYPYDLGPDGLGRDLLPQHGEIRETRAARADILGFEDDQGASHLHTILRLPLSNDGQMVDHIVGVISFSRDVLDRYGRNGPGGLLGR
jgi:hypothetical protein